MQLCPPLGIFCIAYCCPHPMSTAVQYGPWTPKSKRMHWVGLTQAGTAAHDTLHIACGDVSHPTHLKLQ